MTETPHCEGTTSYDCKLQTCHGLPQCGTCCKCTGVCKIEERNRKNVTPPPKHGDVVPVTPAQIADCLKGYTWAVEFNGARHDATFTGGVTADGNIEMRVGKKHLPKTPAPPLGGN